MHANLCECNCINYPAGGSDCWVEITVPSDQIFVGDDKIQQSEEFLRGDYDGITSAIALATTLPSS